MTARAEYFGRGELTLAVALLAAAVLGFEVALMRMLLITSWHHFAFLVISIALLGFGASGVVLSLLRPWLLARARDVLFAVTLAAAVSIPLSCALAQEVPIEARFAPVMLGRVLVVWILYWLLLAVPFLLAATALGLAIMLAGERVPSVYAANLAGSGLGAALAPLAMAALPPAWLPALFGAVALASAAVVRGAGMRVRWKTLLAATCCVAVGLVADRPALRMDPDKYGAFVERLVRQSSATRLEREHGPRGTVELYRSDLFHDVPFLSGSTRPPPLDKLVLDGHAAGSFLRVGHAEDAEVVDGTLMSFAYELVRPITAAPRVLLLGERSGLNVWLAKRRGASRVTVVQPHGRVFALLGARPRAEGSAVFELEGVEEVVETPRHFVERSDEVFDLIQLVALESLAAGSGGIGGLGQDHLATVEGVAACLARLAPGGVLSVCRGIQTPPRDSLKLLATCAEALEREGIARPGEHVVVVRDFLAVAILVKRSPWTPDEVPRLRAAIEERGLTPVWFSGVRADELNQPDWLEGPEDGPGDWYHHAATRIFAAEEREEFLASWAFEIRPATDDRPFFSDFCRLASIPTLREAFGPLWLTRAETAFLFVLAAAAVIGVVALLATVVPLLFVERVRRAAGKTATAAYFAAIGLGYLFFELVVLSRLTLLVGDPVYAAALTLSAFLVFSGAGSLATQRTAGFRPRVLLALVATLITIGLITVPLLDALAVACAALPLVARALIAVAAAAPLAFLLGMPMPVALRRIDLSTPQLVPWAWGVNGFASVLAAPLATALAMTWGFQTVGALAAALYLAAGLAFARLPGGGRRTR